MYMVHVFVSCRIGAIIALVGNEQVFDNVGTFGSDINSELQFLTDFLEETKTVGCVLL